MQAGLELIILILLLWSLECWDGRGVPLHLAGFLFGLGSLTSTFFVFYWRDFLEESTSWLISKFIVWRPPLIRCPTPVVGAGLAQSQSRSSAGLQYLPSVSSYEFCHSRSRAAPGMPSALSWLPTVPRVPLVPLGIWGCGSPSSTGFVINVCGRHFVFLFCLVALSSTGVI